MGKVERRGARRDRSRREGQRVPDLGYYLIITDTKETEKNYFDGIRDLIPEHLKSRLVIKVEKAATVDLVMRAKELRDQDPQYRVPWIVFDRDQVKDFDGIIKNAEIEEVKVGWSNPCIEIWFFAYFGDIPMIADSVTCCNKFSDKYKSETKQKYEKAAKDVYKKLLQYGNEDDAIRLSERKFKQLLNEGKSKPSEMWPGNTVFELIRELNIKKNS
jgi:hypothetical protein